MMIRTFTALLLTVAVSTSFGDTLTLKDGTVYEGKVLRETDEEITLLVSITSTITDEVVLKKEDIRGAVVKTPEDTLEYQKLQVLEIGENTRDFAFYDQSLVACEKFLKRFPESSHAQQVRNQAKALKEERDRVAANEVKVEGEWYTEAEAKENRYQIQATLLAQQMKAQVAQGNFVMALNTFDSLESEYPGSAAYPKSIPFALTTISGFRTHLAKSVTIAREHETRFQEGIAHQREPQKSRMIQAHEQNKQRSEAAFKESTQKWKPFFPTMAESVTALETTAASETERLSKIDPANMNRSVSLTVAARHLLRERKPDEAMTRLGEALKLWSGNEAVPRLNKQAVALKEQLAVEAEEKRAAEKKAADEAAEKAAQKKEAAEQQGKGASTP